MSREAGFTLVELLAALAAGGLLLAGLAAYTGVLARRAADDRPSTAALILEFSPIIETMIAGAVPPEGADAPVIADPERLRLLVPGPQALGGDQPILLNLATVRTAAGAALDLSLSDRAGRPLPVRPVNMRLIDGLRDIAFDYVPAGKRQPLPKLVRIIMRSVRGERWTIVSEPRNNRPANCEFDAISLTCR